MVLQVLITMFLNNFGLTVTSCAKVSCQSNCHYMSNKFCICSSVGRVDCKSICFGYSFELHRQVLVIQTGTHNICLYKKVDKKFTGCNLKTMALLDSVLIGVGMVIGWNTV